MHLTKKIVKSEVFKNSNISKVIKSQMELKYLVKMCLIPSQIEIT